MDTAEIAKALTALSHTQVTGVKEASVLLHLAVTPATSKEIIDITNGRPQSTRMRLGNLREKKLVKYCHKTKLFGLTKEGQKLVDKIVK